MHRHKIRENKLSWNSRFPCLALGVGLFHPVLLQERTRLAKPKGPSDHRRNVAGAAAVSQYRSYEIGMKSPACLLPK